MLRIHPPDSPRPLRAPGDATHSRQRVLDAAGYVLHASPWRETSLVVQAFTRDHGQLALVAKGAKRPASALRPVLSAFQPLALSWSGKGEVKTMTRAECAGIRPLRGRSFLSAWYMNELLLQLLPREDPHPVLFDAYDNALRELAQGGNTAGALRRFEWVLLQETGYGTDLPAPDFDALPDEPLLRLQLRQRLEVQLQAPLATRRVLMQLQKWR